MFAGSPAPKTSPIPNPKNKKATGLCPVAFFSFESW
jgi:hypothetical protein